MSRPQIVAVVLNWCAERETAECVRSLLAQTGVNLAVLIIDNASPDGSGDRLAKQFPDVLYRQTGANTGYAGGNAVGIAWALEQRADLVFVINDDAEVTPGCLAALVDALVANPNAAAATPTIVHAAPPNVVWWAGGRFDEMRALGVHEHCGVLLNALPGPARADAPPRAVTAFTGCAVLLRGSVLRTLGGFRAEFFAYLEDTELGLRFMRAGHMLLHVPSAVAVHKVPFPAPVPSAMQIRLRDRNRRRVATLHLGVPARVAFWTWFLPTRLAHGFSYAIRGDSERMRAIVSGMFGR